jgi:hypothetical protein
VVTSLQRSYIKVNYCYEKPAIISSWYISILYFALTDIF